MKGQKKLEWIAEGYRVVSLEGFGSLNVESIGRAIQKNKSSFYHYFGDMEIFEAELLDYHLERSRTFADEIAACEQILPGMVDIFLAYQTDVLFHKRLRFKREDPAYKACFEKVFKMFEEAVMDKWTIFLGLDANSRLAATFLHFISENFLLQITPKNFTAAWMENYLQEVTQLLQQMHSGK